VVDSGAGAFLQEPRISRAAAFGDLDGDGDVDAVIGDLNGPIRVLRNDCPGGPWLIVEPRDPKGAAGLGCRVEVEVPGRVQRRWITSGGYQSANAPYACFGLPAGTQTADIRVTWPDGRDRLLTGVAVNQHVIAGPE
jgi:hypothetical protein